MSTENCIFCKIGRKDLPAKIVYENETILAVLDISPISDGHTIVIPKNHYLNIESIPVEELNKTIEVVKYIATLIHNRLNIDGYNILQNNFRAAGQVVNHFHFHIIPRRLNDEKFKLYIPREQAPEESLDGILATLKNDSFYSK